jgi:chromosome segregation protein
MYLQKLEIQGFKSFAEKTTLEFNRQLTAVVGPNGSGKSNVADAVRWVLGEQSLKVLRGKKSQDVIFAGSTTKPRLGMAEVSLYLNNEDNSSGLDYQEIVITRRIYRDGDSEYLINKNKVRLLDVQMMLAKASFGQRTYAIIGQGMVDSILTASPQERKEFFDEATGVREYQIKKEQALLKLERSQENLSQSEQLLAEIEPRLKSLHRQVKKLERRAELEAELSTKRSSYYGRLRAESEEELKRLKKQLQQAQINKEQANSAVEKNHQELLKLQAEDTEALAWQKLQNDYQLLVSKRDNIARNLSAIEGKLAFAKAASGQADLLFLEKRQAELKTSELEAENQLSLLEQELKVKEGVWQKKTAEQQKFLDDFKKLQDSANVAKENKAEGGDWQKISVSLNEVIKEQEDFLNFLNENENISAGEIKAKLNGLQKRLVELKNSINALSGTAKTEDHDFQAEMEKFLITKDSLTNELQEARLELEMTKAKKNNLNSQLQNFKNDLAKITAELNSYANATNSDTDLTTEKNNSLSAMAKIDQELVAKKEELAVFGAKQQTIKENFSKFQESARMLQSVLDKANNEVNELQLALTKIEVKREDLEVEISQECPNGLAEAGSEENQEDLSMLRNNILRLKEQLAVIGAIDAEVVAEHDEVNERQQFLSTQTVDLNQAIKSCQSLIKELDNKISEQFETAFNKINIKFQSYFLTLFGGGTAKLILNKIDNSVAVAEDSTEEAENVEVPAVEGPSAKPVFKNYTFGIEIQVTPPGKKLKSINVLSGGEKALTAIALISAIIATNPSPFVILDEVDAALDESNSVRFASIVHELSDKAQFICITHNRATMEQAAILYGVTMGTDGISHLLSVNFEEAEKVAQN